MEIKGRVTSLLPIVEGQGKKGKWSKLEFVIETPGQYPRKVCISLWGQEAIDKYDIEVGLELTAFINVESREHGGRWYSEIRAYKLEWDAQQKRKWQPGGEGKKGAPAFEDSREDTSLRSHYEGQSNNSSTDDLPF